MDKKNSVVITVKYADGKFEFSPIMITGIGISNPTQVDVDCEGMITTPPLRFNFLCGDFVVASLPINEFEFYPR